MKGNHSATRINESPPTVSHIQPKLVSLYCLTSEYAQGLCAISIVAGMSNNRMVISVVNLLTWHNPLKHSHSYIKVCAV